MAQLKLQGDWIAIHLFPLTEQQATYWIDLGGDALLTHICAWDDEDPQLDIPADCIIGNRANLAGDYFAGVELNHGSVELSQVEGHSENLSLETYRHLDSYPEPVWSTDEPLPFDGYRLAYVEYGAGDVVHSTAHNDGQSLPDIPFGITEVLNSEPWAFIATKLRSPVLEPEVDGNISSRRAQILDGSFGNIAVDSE